MDGARQRFRFAERRYNSRAEQSVAAGQRFADRRWSDSQEIPGESLDTEDGSRETSARNHPAAIGFRGTLWRVPQLLVSLPQIDVVNRPLHSLTDRRVSSESTRTDRHRKHVFPKLLAKQLVQPIDSSASFLRALSFPKRLDFGVQMNNKNG